VTELLANIAPAARDSEQNEPPLGGTPREANLDRAPA